VNVHYLGFIGVTTAEKKPTLQPHNNVKFLKAVNCNLLRPDIVATAKTGGLYLHDTHGSQKLPESNALRYIHYSCYSCVH
jgi:hypothetical protein